MSLCKKLPLISLPTSTKRNIIRPSNGETSPQEMPNDISQTPKQLLKFSNFSDPEFIRLLVQDSFIHDKSQKSFSFFSQKTSQSFQNPARSLCLDSESQLQINVAFPVDINKWQQFKNHQNSVEPEPSHSINDTFHVDRAEEDQPKGSNQGMISRIVENMNCGSAD